MVPSPFPLGENARRTAATALATAADTSSATTVVDGGNGPNSAFRSRSTFSTASDADAAAAVAAAAAAFAADVDDEGPAASYRGKLYGEDLVLLEPLPLPLLLRLHPSPPSLPWAARGGCK